MSNRIHFVRLAGYCLSAAVLLGVAMSGDTFAGLQSKPPAQAGQNAPLVIQQGSFAFGGKVITAPNGNTLHCDHGYTDFSIPAGARKLPIVMWHSTSVKTWTSDPKFLGGHQNFQDIFLRRGFGVYIPDLPRQGRASNGCQSTTYTPTVGQDQGTFRNWRLGTWVPPGPPTFFPNSQTPTDDGFLNQILRARYPDNEDFPDTDEVEAGSVASLLDQIGPAILMTHSGSGRYGWLTTLRSPKVTGVVSFEAVEYVFPTGETPPPVPGGRPPIVVPLADFLKLTQIPILVIFGDFTDQLPLWSGALFNARAFVQTVNNHGGNAKLLVLPEMGIFGNSHVMMLEKNNAQIADLVSQFLKDNGLDKH